MSSIGDSDAPEGRGRDGAGADAAAPGEAVAAAEPTEPGLGREPVRAAGDPSAGRPSCIAIVGPTASGKTGLAIAVAERLGGEIVSLDSRQAYRGFAVGTAAPTAEELRSAPHHGVGFLSPDERYGAGRFAASASRWLSEITRRGRVPILAGGTGLFLRALTNPMFREPDAPGELRRRVRAALDGMPPAVLGRWARRLDPGLADRLAAVDPQRAGRTVELTLLTGRALSWWIDHGPPERAPVRAATYALDLPADALRDRIRDRAAGMLRSGAWLAEVEGLGAEGLERARAFDAVGYRHVAAWSRGEIDEGGALELVFADTWAYARRQRTWFRHQLPADAVRLDARNPTRQLAGRIVRDWHARARDET